jgi:cytochrome P450
MPNGIDSIVNAIDSERHAAKRKLIGRVVTERAMRAFEPTLQEQVDVFLGNLYMASRDSRPVNMTENCKRLGLDVVGQLAFGFPLNTQTSPTYRFISKGMTMANYRVNAFIQFPFLKNVVLDSVLHVLSRARRMEYRRTVERMIATRLKMDKHAKNDLYSAVVDHIDTDGIRLSELWSEAAFFIPAG